MKKEKDFSKGRMEIIIKGALLGLLVTAVFMLLFAGIMLGLNTDRAYAAPFATVSLAAGCFAAAFYAAKAIGNKGYLIGLVIGIAVFVVVTLISLAVCKGSVSLNTLFHFIIVLLASLAGGVAGVNKKGGKKYI